MSLKIKMSAIANRIRTLLGSTDAMGLDSMATHLDTAQAEVDTQHDLISQIAAVVARKAAGIVPAGVVNITENGTHDVTKYASALVNVETLPAGVSKLAAGTFTPSVGHQTGGFFVEHGLGITPNFCLLYSDSNVTGEKIRWAQLALERGAATSTYATSPWVIFSFAYSSYSYVSQSSIQFSGLSDAPFDDKNLQFLSTSDYPFKAGATYHWIAGILDNLS
jgi:hypothetical protein